MSNEKNPWITHSSKTEYENPWIRVDEHQVTNVAGNKGIYGTVHFKNIAIGIVPVDSDGNTYLVGQYRYPLKKYSWEIPEGGGPLDVAPLESAKRELKEETGITASKWEEILQMDLSNSATDEKAIVYLARDLEFGDSSPEEDEDLVVKKLPLDKAYELAVSGEIRDAISVAALMRVKMMT